MTGMVSKIVVIVFTFVFRKPLKYIDGEEAIKYNPEIEIKPTPFSKRNTSGIKRIISLKSIFPMRLLNKNMLVKLR